MSARRTLAAAAPAGAVVGVALNALELFELDAWAKRQDDPCLDRSEAIRQLMRLALCEHPDL